MIAGALTIAIPASASTRRRAMTLLRIVSGLAGLAVVAFMIHRTGAAAIEGALRPAWRWLPVVLLLDAARIGMEALATYYAYGGRGHLLPWTMLVRAHVVGYAVAGVMPAGRTSSEAAKVAMLGRYAGVPAAIAAGATNQAVTLLVGAIVSIPCALAAWHITGVSTVTLALVAQAAVLAASGVAIRAGARGESALGTRIAARFGLNLSEFRTTSRAVALLPRGPTAAMLVGRLFQVCAFAILAHAVGVDISVARVFYAQGISMIVLAVGVLVPGQLGAADGAFAASAEPLGTTVAAAMSIALLGHVLQMIWVAIGATVLLTWRAHERSHHET
jgi:Lysylphosphatidylglycerol synthase TM region